MNLDEYYDWIVNRMSGITPRFHKDSEALIALKAAVNFANDIEKAYTEEEYPEYFEERAEKSIWELHDILTCLTQ